MERRGCVDSGCHGGERRSTPPWPASAPVTSSALWRRGAHAFSIAITDGAATVRTRGAVSATASTSQRLDCPNVQTSRRPDVQTAGTVAAQGRRPWPPTPCCRGEPRRRDREHDRQGHGPPVAPSGRGLLRIGLFLEAPRAVHTPRPWATSGPANRMKGPCRYRYVWRRASCSAAWLPSS